MLVGCTVLGTTLAVIGYVGLDLLWRASISGYLEKKRRREVLAWFVSTDAIVISATI